MTEREPVTPRVGDRSADCGTSCHGTRRTVRIKVSKNETEGKGKIGRHVRGGRIKLA